MYESSAGVDYSVSTPTSDKVKAVFLRFHLLSLLVSLRPRCLPPKRSSPRLRFLRPCPWTRRPTSSCCSANGRRRSKEPRSSWCPSSQSQQGFSLRLFCLIYLRCLSSLWSGLSFVPHPESLSWLSGRPENTTNETPTRLTTVIQVVVHLSVDVASEGRLRSPVWERSSGWLFWLVVAGRADPDCMLGQLLKMLFMNDDFTNAVKIISIQFILYTLKGINLILKFRILDGRRFELLKSLLIFCQ